MSFCVSLAIRRALDAGRKDAGDKNTWYQLGNNKSNLYIVVKMNLLILSIFIRFYIDGPATTEKILMTSLTNKEQMTL